MNPVSNIFLVHTKSSTPRKKIYKTQFQHTELIKTEDFENLRNSP